MAIFHIVLLAFEPLVPLQEVQGVCDRLLALKDNCIHPVSKKPYVKTGLGGRENSTEGLQNGITHVFVLEFENEQDREFYLKEDPVHLEFAKSIAGVASKVQVVNFIPGVF